MKAHCFQPSFPPTPAHALRRRSPGRLPTAGKVIELGVDCRAWTGDRSSSLPKRNFGRTGSARDGSHFGPRARAITISTLIQVGAHLMLLWVRTGGRTAQFDRNARPSSQTRRAVFDLQSLSLHREPGAYLVLRHLHQYHLCAPALAVHHPQGEDRGHGRGRGGVGL
jgi:hypothetical protein